MATANLGPWITQDTKHIVKQDSNYHMDDMQPENNVHLRPDPPGVWFTTTQHGGLLYTFQMPENKSNFSLSKKYMYNGYAQKILTTHVYKRSRISYLWCNLEMHTLYQSEITRTNKGNIYNM